MASLEELSGISCITRRCTCGAVVPDGATDGCPDKASDTHGRSHLLEPSDSCVRLPLQPTDFLLLLVANVLTQTVIVSKKRWPGVGSEAGGELELLGTKPQGHAAVPAGSPSLE